MKKLLAVVTLLASIAAHAADDYSYTFPTIKLNELAKLILGDTVKSSYIFDADFSLDQTAVSIDVKGLDRGEAAGVLSRLLKDHGFFLSNSGKVVVVKKKPVEQPLPPGEKLPPEIAALVIEEPQDLLVYRPKFRAVSYLTDIVSSIYGKTSIATKRSVQPGDNGAPPPVVEQNPPRDSATALIDRESDVFVFRGPADRLAAVAKLIAELDVASAQVMVKAIVYEVSNEDRQASAVTILANLLGGKIELELGGNPLTQFASVSIGGLEAVFSALSTDSRFKVVSSPSMRVLDGATGRLTVGSETPVLGAITINRDGRDIQNVDYRASGVILHIKPQVHEESIRLDLNQEISSFIPTTTGVNNSPTLIKRAVQTNIDIKSGEIIVLGGLDEQKTSADEFRIPFFPPFLSSKGNQRTRTELVLVLQVSRI